MQQLRMFLSSLLYVIVEQKISGASLFKNVSREMRQSVISEEAISELDRRHDKVYTQISILQSFQLSDDNYFTMKRTAGCEKIRAYDDHVIYQQIVFNILSIQLSCKFIWESKPFSRTLFINMLVLN